jgi:uncharacterized protein
MDLETGLKALKRLTRPDRAVTVELAGGEPLLQFDLIKELLTEARKVRPLLRFALQTNGLLLDQEKLTFLRQNRVGLGLSLDGLPQINDLTRGNSRAVLKALDLLDQNRVGVNITVVLTRYNLAEMPKFLLFLGSRPSVRVINLDLVRPLGRAESTDLKPMPEDIYQAVPRMLSTLDFVNQRRWPPLKIREADQNLRRACLKEQRPYCMAAEGRAVAVDPAGGLYLCASLSGREEYRLGNLDDQKLLDPVEMTRNWHLPPECRKCEVRLICRGGCPSRRIAYNGRPDMKSSLDCALRRTIFKESSGK